MTRALTRTNLHSSLLIRTLADLSVLQTTEPAAAFGERLGLWIGFTDAIALTSVHNSIAVEAAALPDQSGDDGPLDVAFAKMRSQLENTITKSHAPNTGRTRAELTLPKLEGPLDDVRAYAAFRRYHQAHQRDMETGVRGVRVKLRHGVARASPRLRQLVALDATFDSILVEREGRLLATLPSLLEKRFNHLRKAYQQALTDTQRSDDNPDLWMKPGAWLARFCAELQTVLLAELDFRLQPAVGLLEAFLHETRLQPV